MCAPGMRSRAQLGMKSLPGSHQRGDEGVLVVELPLARVVRLATGVVVVVILVGILIHVLDANTSNAIVSVFDDAARWLTQPFHGIFDLDGAKAQLAVNWGLAALVYAIVGGLVARLLGRSGIAGRLKRPMRRRTAS